MNRIACSIVKLFLLPLGIVITVFLIIMLIAYGGQPLRDIGNGIEKTAIKLNRCLHRMADGIDRVKKIPEKTNEKIKKLKEAGIKWDH
jgi:hypothetical protein